MKDYYTLTNRGRALRLRQLALAALADYDLDVKSVRLITNLFNGIFRVDTQMDANSSYGCADRPRPRVGCRAFIRK